MDEADAENRRLERLLDYYHHEARGVRRTVNLYNAGGTIAAPSLIGTLIAGGDGSYPEALFWVLAVFVLGLGAGGTAMLLHVQGINRHADFIIENQETADFAAPRSAAPLLILSMTCLVVGSLSGLALLYDLAG